MAQEAASVYQNGLILAGYPSCEDCMTWSEDGLAVATGATLNILNGFSRHAKWLASDPRQVSTIVLRVDQFTKDEWPERPLATVDHMSIGEEQSESTVIALAWSPPGLGIHRRCVLAVLTSNLLLSLWETDGLQRNWRRTCIVNQHLTTTGSHEKCHSGVPLERRQSRIRAFCWSAPLHVQDGPSWGLHFLVVVDDSNRLTLISLDKTNRNQHGTWCFNSLSSIILEHSPRSGDGGKRLTRLQGTVTQSTPVRYMETQKWMIEDPNTSDEMAQIKATLCLHYQCMNSNTPFFMQVEVNVSGGRICKYATAISPSTTTPSSTEPVYTENLHMHMKRDFESSLEWQAILKDSCADYDKRYHLEGLYRVCPWGSAVSPLGDVMCICITLHPLDMYEYSSAVEEKSRVLFRPLQMTPMSRNSKPQTEPEVIVKILEFVVHNLDPRSPPDSGFDLKLIRGLFLWSCLKQNESDASPIVRKIAADCKVLESVLSAQKFMASDQSQIHQDTDEHTCLYELCDICGSEIQFSSATSAICQTGHAFSRCCLSLIAIQEPGISKYCAGCNREFLDLTKIESHGDRRLMDKVFDKFDICPYCEQKYRG